MPDNARAIAERLTEAQQAELLALGDGWLQTGEIPEWIGQLPFDDTVMVRQRCYWEERLGPLALAIRTILTEQSHD